MSSPSKRSRLSRPSSQGEVATLMPVDSPMPSWLGKKRAAASSSSKPVIKNFDHPGDAGKKSIWTLDDDSPVEEYDQGRIDEGFGAFWRSCSLCKKPIHEEMNIYMYGFLQAFCSVECRDAKIAVDDKFGRPSSQPVTASTPRKPGRRHEVARSR